MRDVIADRGDGAGGFVAGDDRVGSHAPFVFEHGDIGIADSAVLEHDFDVIGPERTGIVFERPNRLAGRGGGVSVKFAHFLLRDWCFSLRIAPRGCFILIYRQQQGRGQMSVSFGISRCVAIRSHRNPQSGPCSAILLIALLAAVVGGCGTTHHFLPAQPLEKGQWQISVAWHYDLSGLHPQTGAFIPHLNAYGGLTDDVVIGFGYELPIFLSHGTLAAYVPESSDNYWIAYFHGKFLSVSDNPLLEMGGAYSIRAGSARQMFSLGLVSGRPHEWYSPVFKYSLTGRDVGLGLVHSFGFTKAWVQSHFPEWPPSQEYLYTFKAGEVIGVSRYEVEPSLDNYRCRTAFALIKANGDSLVFWGDHEMYVDQFYDGDIEFDEWLGSDLRLMRNHDVWLIVDQADLQRQAEAGSPMVIRRAPLAFTNRIERINGWIRDNSIGWAVFAWPR